MAVLMSNDSISYYFIKQQEVAAEHVKEFAASSLEMIAELEENQVLVSDCEKKTEIEIQS